MFRILSFSISLSLLAPITATGKDLRTYTSDDTGVKIRYSNCLRYNDNTGDDGIDFRSTGECEGYSHGQGFGVTIWRTSGFKNLQHYERSAKTRASFLTREDHQFGKDKGYISSMLDPESNKLIDRKDQSNYHWKAAVWCGKYLVTIGLADHLSKSEREKARKNPPPMPLAFKELVEGLSCK